MSRQPYWFSTFIFFFNLHSSPSIVKENVSEIPSIVVTEAILNVMLSLFSHIRNLMFISSRLSSTPISQNTGFILTLHSGSAHNFSFFSSRFLVRSILACILWTPVKFLSVTPYSICLFPNAPCHGPNVPFKIMPNFFVHNAQRTGPLSARYSLLPLNSTAKTFSFRYISTPLFPCRYLSGLTLPFPMSLRASISHMSKWAVYTEQ